MMNMDAEIEFNCHIIATLSIDYAITLEVVGVASVSTRLLVP